MAKEPEKKLSAFSISGATKGLAATMKAAQPGEKIVELMVKDVKPDPGQPRKRFDKAKLQGLAEEMKRDGQQQAVIVRPIDDAEASHMIVFGERRWRALQLAGVKTIKAIIRPYTENDMLDVRTAQLAENMQREDMSLADVVAGVVDLVNRSDTAYAAVTIGESKTTVSKLTKIGNATGPVAQLLEAGTMQDFNALYTLALVSGVNESAAQKLADSWEDEGKRANARAQVAALYDKVRGIEPTKPAGSDDESPVVKTKPGKESPRVERVARAGKEDPVAIPEDLPILVSTHVEVTGKALVVHTKHGVISFDKKLIEQIKKVS